MSRFRWRPISAILALVLFQFGANIAGVFELSVCAGLITVLFIATVSLTKDSDQKVETRLPAYFIPLFVLIFVGIDYLHHAVAGAFGCCRRVLPSLPRRFSRCSGK